MWKSDTTPNFEGLIAVTRPDQKSWVCRNMNLYDKVPGVYCLKAFGDMPEDN